MNDAMQAQTDAVIRLLGERYSPQDLRDIGYSQRAIDAAINAIQAQSDQP